MISVVPDRPDPKSYLPPDPSSVPRRDRGRTEGPVPAGSESFHEAIAKVIEYVRARGYVVDPWQIAAYVTAVRTKPLVTLAGISGTGKSSLPRLVAEATGAEFELVPVNPEWTDSGEIVGHRDLTGNFIPGPLIRAAARAASDPASQIFFMLDEMNLARPEYYLAEVLAVIETRSRGEDGTTSYRLKPDANLDSEGFDWSEVRLPPNLAIVGSVNMDETTFGFARKLLDRTFVIEFSEIDLSAVGTLSDASPSNWPPEAWEPPYLSLSEVPGSESASEAIDLLKDVNDILQPMQQHVGYRVRDEVAIFVENAQSCIDLFATSDELPVDPLDLALFMKVLPRIQGSSALLSTALEQLDEWANGQNSIDRALPFCESRIALMRERLIHDGYTSFWV